MASFDPDKFLQEEEQEFNPDSFLSKEDKQEEEFSPELFLSEPETQSSEVPVQKKLVRVDRLRQLKAGLAGAGQGATMGWMDEAMAAADATLDQIALKAFQMIDPEEAAKISDSETFQKQYLTSRDAIRKELEDLQKKYPTTFTGSEIGGALATIALPGGALAKAAGKIGTSVKSSKVGTMLAKTTPQAVKKTVGAAAMPVGTGAVAGAGLSDDEDALLKDTLLGAGTGAVFAGLGPAVRGAASKFARKADIGQLRKLGFSTKDFEKLNTKDKQEMAKFARELKILTPNAEKTMKNAAALKDQSVKNIQAVHSKIKETDVPFIDKNKLISKIKSEMESKHVRPTRPEAKQYLDGMLDELNKVNPSDFKSVHKFRQGRGFDLSDQGLNRIQQKIANDTFALYAEGMKEAIEAAGQKIKDPKLFQEFSSANKQFQLSDKLARASRNAHARSEAAAQQSTLSKRMELGLRALRPSNIAAAAVNPALLPVKMVLEAAARKYGTVTLSKMQRRAEQGDNLAKRVRDVLVDRSPVSSKQAKSAATVGIIDLLRDKD